MRLLIIADNPAAESTLELFTDGTAASGEEAIGDAPAEFEAEHVVLVDPDDEELAGAVRERYGLPVTELSAA